MKNIMDELREWMNESKNPRNDGWVQAGYREKLHEVYNVLKNFLFGEDEKKER